MTDRQKIAAIRKLLEDTPLRYRTRAMFDHETLAFIDGLLDIVNEGLPEKAP